jgi:hypothetical protein
MDDFVFCLSSLRLPLIPIVRKPEPDNFLKLPLGASFKKLSVVGF